MKILGFGLLAIVCILLVILFFTGFGRDFRNLWSKGVIQHTLSEGEKREFDESSTANLRALHQAMMNFLQSEGQLPEGNDWMDSIAPFGAATDLKEGEAEKKFHDPALGDPSAYGYALNSAAAGKFYDPKGNVDDDFEDVKLPLIFTSTDTAKNASGSPDEIGREGGLAITLDGTIVKLD